METVDKRWKVNFLIFVLEKWGFEIVLCIFQVHISEEKEGFRCRELPRVIGGGHKDRIYSANYVL